MVGFLENMVGCLGRMADLVETVADKLVGQQAVGSLVR